MELREKLNKLEEILNGYGQMIVAFSGGVDSTFLLAFAHKIWGDDRIAAITATGPHFAPDETEYAGQVCDRLGISHKYCDVSHVINMIKRNPEDRCYHCKREIFSGLKERAEMVGSVLADGTNADDMADYRPGYKAVQELGVASPLKDAGLTKAEIRQAMEEMAEADPQLKTALGMTNAPEEGITIWEKPAFACLASRIPYGETITSEKLKAIYDGEVFLRAKGFAQVRVRCHEIAGRVSGNGSRFIARIELEPADIARFCGEGLFEETEGALKEAGFEYVTLDLGGYSKGKLNGQLQKEAQAGAASKADAPPDRIKVTETVHRGHAENVETADVMAEIDRFLQEVRERTYSFDDFVEIIRTLRAPGGCPWDRAQTHESLKKHMVEEANEVLDAIDEGDSRHICEELGDVLLQIVLNAQIASDNGEFTIEDVIQCVSEKMVRRHPHVFGNIDVSSVDEGLDLWEEIKKREKMVK